jgi:hypothetical protein
MVKKPRKPRKPAKKKRKSNLTSFKDAMKSKVGDKKLRKLSFNKRNPKVDPMWDLDRDGITYSTMSKFMNCRERFRLSVVEGWQPKKINLPLEFGNVFHLFTEARLQGMDPEDMEFIGVNYIRERAEDDAADSETVQELNQLLFVSHVTYIEYCKYWEATPSFKDGNKNIYDRDIDWIGKETPFDINHRMPNGRVIRLRGKRDGDFYRRRGQKEPYLLETKTKGNIDEMGIRDSLFKDMQTGLYLYSMQKDYRLTPAGCLYNVIRRAQLKPRKDEPPRAFADRVQKDIQLRPEWYFMRWRVEIEEGDIQRFIDRMLNPILHQICQWWDSVKKNPLDPWTTEQEVSVIVPTEDCKTCKGYGDLVSEKKNGKQTGRHLPASKRNLDKHAIGGGCIGICPDCGPQRETIKVPNPHHYERPFGAYDGMMHSQRGDFFEIMTNKNYYLYKRRKYTFPELDDPINDISKYLEK